MAYRRRRGRGRRRFKSKRFKRRGVRPMRIGYRM